MTSSTTVGETSGDASVGVEIADAVAYVRALPLRLRKLSLEQLTSAPDRAKRIAVDHIERRTGSHDTASARSDLIAK